jgi:hypothetical protein
VAPIVAEVVAAGMAGTTVIQVVRLPPGPGKVGRNQCRRCGKKGHWVRDCWSKPKRETAYTA